MFIPTFSYRSLLDRIDFNTALESLKKFQVNLFGRLESSKKIFKNSRTDSKIAENLFQTFLISFKFNFNFLCLDQKLHKDLKSLIETDEIVSRFYLILDFETNEKN